MTRLPFWCPHCNSFDRRNWATGGCRYFDDWPEGRASGGDPPCVFEDYDADWDARRRRMRIAWMCVALALALVTAVLVTSGAWGHEALTGWNYPISCCNGNTEEGDCQSIPAKSVKAVDGGYQVTLGPGDHHLITKGSHSWLKSMGETRQSKDENFHACLYPDEQTLRCFFAPPPTF